MRRLCEASSSSSSSIAPPPDGGPRARVAGHRHDQAPGFAASLAGGGQRRGGAPNQPLKKTPRRRRRRPPRSRSRPSPAQRQDRGPPCVSNAVDAGAPPWSPTSGGPNATEQTRAAPLRAQRAPPVAAALVSAPAMPAPTLAAPAAQPRAKGREMHCSNKHRIGHRRSRLFMLHARARATARLSKARRRGGGRGRADGAPLGKHARAAQGARRKARGARRGARQKNAPPRAAIEKNARAAATCWRRPGRRSSAACVHVSFLDAGEAGGSSPGVGSNEKRKTGRRPVLFVARGDAPGDARARGPGHRPARARRTTRAARRARRVGLSTVNTATATGPPVAPDRVARCCRRRRRRRKGARKPRPPPPRAGRSRAEEGGHPPRSVGAVLPRTSAFHFSISTSTTIRMPGVVKRRG